MTSLSEISTKITITEVFSAPDVPTVFCDCDGVLADFYNSFKRIFSLKGFTEVENYLNAADGWDKVAKICPELFSKLDVLEDAHKLIETLARLRDNQIIRLQILTALPDKWLEDANLGDNATAHKKQWIVQNFPQIKDTDVIVCSRKEKAAYGATDKLFYRVKPILIDDYDKNLSEWSKHVRGYGIKHINTISTLKQLKVYLAGLRIGTNMPDTFNSAFDFELDEPNPNEFSLPVNEDVKPFGIDKHGDLIATNKRDLPKGKGDGARFDIDNPNLDDEPVPSSQVSGQSTVVINPPLSFHVTVDKLKNHAEK